MTHPTIHPLNLPSLFDGHLHRAIETNFEMSCEALLALMCRVSSKLRQGIYYEIGHKLVVRPGFEPWTIHVAAQKLP